jgi:hypothetical protein
VTKARRIGRRRTDVGLTSQAVVPDVDTLQVVQYDAPIVAVRCDNNLQLAKAVVDAVNPWERAAHASRAISTTSICEKYLSS